ncbi:ABC transporter permease [Streptomonospora sp. S1-112]|uniref:Transport permease protein n=1 Tax=Streptomonospora mangrovi TaxID=2883123 RepID=A0A9X3SGH6_9ACTN|nr:ABC transporter permease [Streptomonospora mangrovi]MDA0566907.1 ABC transporter permease [Streptomonospora mangrovi]
MTPAAPAAPAAPTAGAALELRAGAMVWRREMLHYLRDPARAAVSLFQPMLFLFILGVGLARLLAESGADGSAGDAYLRFLFPGVLVMAAQAPAVSAGASIVWDRESGFLREMLVAPVRRSTLVLAKCLGGATVATCNAVVVLACAGLVGIPYHPGLLAALLAQLGLTALAMTALGAAVAVSIRRIQTFHTVLGVLMTPLLFLSGMMFPLSAMPGWMAAVALANPLTYAVDAQRRTIAAVGGADPAESAAFLSTVEWGGWQPPVALELLLVAACTAAALAWTSRRFARPR